MQNFFKLFSLDETYDIDLQKLDEYYFKLQALYHPDVVTPAIARNDVSVDAILINQGYNILRDEFERAAHILELHGIFIKDDKLAPKLPVETLERILEMRDIQQSHCEKGEIVSSTSLTRNDAKYEEIATRSMIARNDVNYDLLRAAISAAFAAKDYNLAALKVLELRYLEK